MVKEENRRSGKRYYTKEIGDDQRVVPIISLVLYFGREKWKRPLSLAGMLEIQEEDKELVLPFIQERVLRVIDLGRQDKETRKKYRSDFRHVVDYLACGKDKHKLKQFMENSTRELAHPQEFLDVVGAVGSDARYQKVKEMIRCRTQKGEKVSMCVIAEELENTGIQKGLEKGNMLCLIRQTLKKRKKGFSVSDIADMLEEEERTIEQILLAAAEAGTENAEQVYDCL